MTDFIKEKIDVSDWYDGYEVNTNIPIEMREKYRMGEYEGKTISIYSPLSVTNAMASGVIQNYWNKTENYEALAEYIRMNYDDYCIKNNLKFGFFHIHE